MSNRSPLRLCTFALALAAACSSTKAAPSNAAIAVYLQSEAGVRRLFAVAEDGRSAPVALSPAGQRADFVGQLSGRRVIYALLGQDASVLSVHRVLADGSGDAVLGTFPEGAYAASRGAWELAGRVVVQLTRKDGTPELLASTGAGFAHLGDGRWAGAAGDRVVYLAHATSAVRQIGDVRSVKADGSGDLALGGGDGDDLLHGVADVAVYLTEHASGPAEVHAVDADGGARAVRPGSGGLLLEQGRLVASRSGALERLDRRLSATALALPQGAAKALAVRADGTVLVHVAGQGVFAADGASARLLDGFFAADALAAQIAAFPSGERLVYTANGDAGSYLRAAALDGTGAFTLAEGHQHEVLFSGLHAGRALFFRTAGYEIGGRLSTVALDGSGEQAVGDQATGTAAAADHDFGGLSKAGRLFFEAELTERSTPRLYVVDPTGAVRTLTRSLEYTSFAALVP